MKKTSLILSSLDDTLDALLPHVRPYSEDVREFWFWQDKSWLEFSDADFTEQIIHVFKRKKSSNKEVDEEGNAWKVYERVEKGDAEFGEWKEFLNYNRIEVKFRGGIQVYDVDFINDDFMVLRKLGHQVKEGKRKYIALGHEITTSKYTWAKYCEDLYWSVIGGNWLWPALGVAAAVFTLIAMFYHWANQYPA